MTPLHSTVQQALPNAKLHRQSTICSVQTPRIGKPSSLKQEIVAVVVHPLVRGPFPLLVALFCFDCHTFIEAYAVGILNL
jgi:hypothetical protein